MMRKWDDHISEKLCNFILFLLDSSWVTNCSENNPNCGHGQQQQQQQLIELQTFKEHFLSCFRMNGGREMFQAAFTTSSVDPDENYEVFEQIGDAIVGKFLIQYAYMRFPSLRNTKGPGVVTRIKMKYASKKFLSHLAEKMQLDLFIRASSQEIKFRKQALLDDIFESFFGCLEHFLSERCMLGLGKGHEIVFNILKFLFDQEELSLKYEELNDPKTRLKQLFDQFKILLGPRPNYVNFSWSGKNDNSIFISPTSVSVSPPPPPSPPYLSPHVPPPLCRHHCFRHRHRRRRRRRFYQYHRHTPVLCPRQGPVNKFVEFNFKEFSPKEFSSFFPRAAVTGKGEREIGGVGEGEIGGVGGVGEGKEEEEGESENERIGQMWVTKKKKISSVEMFVGTLKWN